MGVRKAVAQAISSVSTVALQKVFRRPAGNFPGKAALYVDPNLIADIAPKLQRGSICVVGTNGKTTITNMVADCLEAAGHTVVCNRGGANLDSGVATSLLQAKTSDWGVFECDELWLAKILPGLQSNYVLLLNLFRDQLDRVGEMDRIQESIAGALKASPQTVLVYNADDPHCEAIARMVTNECIPFGIGEDLGLIPEGMGQAHICQACDGMLDYTYRSYDQLGAYACTQCDFARSPLKFSARACAIEALGMSFDVVAATDERAVAGGEVAHLKAPYTGTYMIYNLLAVYVAGHLAGLSNDVIQQAIGQFDPQNGRLEYVQVHGHQVLLNLAKNPTGFNQNLALISQDTSRAAAAFFVNDMEGDGRDVSWIWDISFEDLAGRDNLDVFVGGMRKHDLQLRLKYAGIPARLVDDATDVMRKVAALPQETNVYMIANYTSLPDVRAACVKMAEEKIAPIPTQADRTLPDPFVTPEPAGDSVRIIHVLPDLLNLNGDGGNVAVLVQRLAWRGIPATVEEVTFGQEADLASADIVYMAGGPDREGRLACEDLQRMRDQLETYVEEGGVLLATGGGLQLLGSCWYAEGEEVLGLGILNVQGILPEDTQERIVGDIVLDVDVASIPVVGYENHAGRIKLGPGIAPFGTIDAVGVGNAEGAGMDGVRYNNVIATNVHGPVLGKNPQVADWLLERALERKAGMPVQLDPLDDTIEQKANAFMLTRLGVA